MKTVFEKSTVLMLLAALTACGGGGGGTAVDATVAPTPTPTATSYLGVAAGGGHTVAIKSDGTLLAWGSNLYGQLGDGSTVTRVSATQVGVGAAAVGSAIYAGEFHSVALGACSKTGAGCSMYTWGGNDSGQLGDGTTTGKTVPTLIKATGWLDIATGGMHTAAVKRDSTTGGTLWTWGRNDKGQLGVIDTTVRYAPTQITTCTTNGTTTAVCGTTWSRVAAGALHTVAMQQSGAVYSWGANTRGQMGIGTITAGFTSPWLVSGTKKFKSIAAGGDHTLGILDDYTLWVWGANYFGQLGDGTIDDKSAPVQVIGGEGLSNDWRMVSAGGGHNDAGSDMPSNGGHSLGVKTDGTLWAWGSNAYGQLGTGRTEDAIVPTKIGPAGVIFTSVSAGKLHSFAMDDVGKLWAWGYNLNGQLGNGTSGTTAKNILVPTRLN